MRRRGWVAAAMVVVMVLVGTSCMTGPIGRMMQGGQRVEIGVAPIGASISVDGQMVGTVGNRGLVFYVRPGTHRLKAEYSGYEPWVTTIQLYSGEVLRYDLPPLSEWQKQSEMKGK